MVIRQGKALHMHHRTFTVNLKNIQSDCHCEYTSNRVNVFGRGVIVSGHPAVCLAVTTLFKLQFVECQEATGKLGAAVC